MASSCGIRPCGKTPERRACSASTWRSGAANSVGFLSRAERQRKPYVVLRTRAVRVHGRRARMPIRLHPALEDLLVAVSTTVGAWLLAHQFGWMFWG
jgi:hypothetical protein